MDSVGEQRGFFHFTVLTPSFFFFLLGLTTGFGALMHFTACGSCFMMLHLGLSARVKCLIICSMVSAAQARHFPQEKLPQ